MVNNLEFLGFSKPMALAMVEALKVNPYPNPRVGATLVDKHGGVKAISNHSKKGQNHAELNIFKQAAVKKIGQGQPQAGFGEVIRNVLP